MAIAAWKYAGTPATGAVVTVRTVAAAKTDIVKSIHVTNKTAASATIRITLGGAEFAHDMVVPANGTLDWDAMGHVLVAGDTVQLGQGTAGSLDVLIGGLEYP